MNNTKTVIPVRDITEMMATLPGVDHASGPAILSSIYSDGVAVTMSRFPECRQAIPRIASTFSMRHMIDVPDSKDCTLYSNNIKWSMATPTIVEDFKVIAHDRDTFRSHFRLSLSIPDVAEGMANGSSLIGDKAISVSNRDPFLLVSICRAVAPLIRSKLTSYLERHDGINMAVRRFAKNISNLLTRTNKLIPNSVISVRRLPHIYDDHHHHLSVDYGLTLTFEISVTSAGENRIIQTPDVITDSSYFEIAGSVNAMSDAATYMAAEDRDRINSIVASIKDLTGNTVEGISPMRRRRRNMEVALRGPPKVPHSQITTEKGGETVTVDVVHPLSDNIHSAISANMAEDIRKAYSWWKSKGVAAVSSLANMAIKALGGDIGVDDIDTLIDVSLPTIGHMVLEARFEPGFEFSNDSGVVGLARLLKEELERRLQ